MPYHVIIVQSVAKEIRNLPKAFIAPIFEKIKHLADNPRPVGSKKLSGSSNKWRIRQGNYRII